MAHYLICYDIANVKRLGRVHRCVIKRAAFIQFSVYYLRSARKDLEELLAAVESLLAEKEDDVRVYMVEALEQAVQAGQSFLPDEVLLLN